MLDSAERARVEGAMAAYCRARPYFHVFLRPLEHVLFARHAAAWRAPVADVGCGDGFFMRLLADRLRIDVGVDVAPRACRNPYGTYGAVRLAAGGRMPLESATFNTILSNSVVEHVAAPRAWLAEIARALRPGGEVVLTVTLRAWDRALNRALRAVHRPAGDLPSEGAESPCRLYRLRRSA